MAALPEPPPLPPPLPAPAVDTHGHLSDPRLAPTAERLLARAAAVGVAYVVDPAVDAASAETALAHARRFPRAVRAAVGVHPHEAAALGPDDWARVEALAADPLCVAVGEVGLDHQRVFSPPAVQEECLERSLDLARRLDKPVLLHVRAAYRRTLEILDGAGRVRGILHAFWGDRETAEAFLVRGFLLGVGGAVTFRREEGLRQVIAALPPGSFVLETDAPYLAPEPVRGRTNEPALVAYTARRVAAVRGVEVAELVRETTAAAARLLGWPAE
ncbi:MAG: TatD family hydrolase [Firmicutes bacterium]|nr:TatD family hydrolase [Bacillota bacterium]